MSADAVFDPERILRALNGHGVRYVVVGGLAVAAHGVIRATADLDLVIDRDWDNAAALADTLRELGAVDPDGSQRTLSREALARRADRRFRTPHGDVHVLHEVSGVPEYRQLLPPDHFALGELIVPVATLSALRAMKRSAGRDKDRIDLAELDALHGPSGRDDE
jgi:hypothetical protein